MQEDVTRKQLQESEFDSVTDIDESIFFDEEDSYNEVQSLKMRIWTAENPEEMASLVLPTPGTT